MRFMLHEPIRPLFTSQYIFPCNHCSLLFHYHSLSERKQIKFFFLFLFPSVGNKSCFHIEGYRKAQRCKGKDYIGALRIDSNVTHEEAKNFITAPAVFEGNQKHFMLLTDLLICHKILEIDSQPLSAG